MNLGDLVQLSRGPYVNMYEDDDMDSIEEGDRFYKGEIGLVLGRTGQGMFMYYRILTPRGSIGWIMGNHLRSAG